VLISHLVDVTT